MYCPFEHTNKLFCGHCGAIMNGESGTSKMAVIKAILSFLENEQAIAQLTRIYDLQFQENTYVLKLEEQIQETQKKIENLIQAAEQGFVSETSARRLKELEETKKKQEIALIQEQIKSPILTLEQISFGIYKFTKLDISTREGKQALIDGFVNAIYLYDDHIKVLLNYKDGTKIITLEEIESSDLNSVTAPKRRFLIGFPIKNRRFLYSRRLRKIKKRGSFGGFIGTGKAKCHKGQF